MLHRLEHVCNLVEKNPHNLAKPKTNLERTCESQRLKEAACSDVSPDHESDAVDLHAACIARVPSALKKYSKLLAPML
jgi:hypothetical protein